MADTPLDEQLAGLLDVFEERLAESAVANSPFVTEMARHIIAAGGKRFRPLLVFLSSRFGGEVDEDDLLRAAMVMELTHVASLYHDDVMDAADLRRGAPSANRLWGNSVAILVGDFLFARASTTVAELGVEYVHLQAETFSRLVQGQIAETKGAGDGEDPLAHYIQVIADKTGSLIAASARFGGMVSGAPEPTLDALSAFGEEVGLVFQLSDDLIDITSTTTGKTPGTDLREGVPTLPVLMLRAENDPADAELLARIDSDLSSDEALAEVLAALREHPVMGRAKAEVERRAQIAREHLAPLPEGEAKDALLQVCTDLVERTN
ncbi:polyprenyl synthetase family protein [Tessaracoccus lacteus]|uniref:polyprenyl synthetase family protein n=1 Tax=Tessaracoccus lacteus TaxID=3041766 RepID=UPI003F691576